MNSDQLKQFKTIVECGNITRAAEQLYISQPALSMSLTKLESECGRQLFIRKGKTLELTAGGEKLFHYANIVVNTIDEAEKAMREETDDQTIIYRIGGTGATLLMSGSYNIVNQKMKLVLVHNKELPKIFSEDVDLFVIADDRYMGKIKSKAIGKKFLYRQQLLLSVHEDDPLADQKSISVKELSELSLVGRSGKMGFNDWLEDIKTDNQCDLHEEYSSDYVFFATEGANIGHPFLMSSFGESVANNQLSFKKRKNIVVRGKYTERDIYLWYDKGRKEKFEPYIDLILRNAKLVRDADAEIRS